MWMHMYRADRLSQKQASKQASKHSRFPPPASQRATTPTKFPQSCASTPSECQAQVTARSIDRSIPAKGQQRPENPSAYNA